MDKSIAFLYPPTNLTVINVDLAHCLAQSDEVMDLSEVTELPLDIAKILAENTRTEIYVRLETMSAEIADCFIGFDNAVNIECDCSEPSSDLAKRLIDFASCEIRLTLDRYPSSELIDTLLLDRKKRIRLISIHRQCSIIWKLLINPISDYFLEVRT